MKRRDFLKISALAAGSAALAGCGLQYPTTRVASQVFIPEHNPVDGELWFASTCALCPSACGIVVRTVDGRAKKIEGNPLHPVSRGKLCPRGQAAVESLYDPDRIPGALRRRGERGEGTFEWLPWDQVLDEVVSRLQQAGDSVLFFTGPNDGHAGMVMDRFARALGGPGRIVFSATGSNALRQASNIIYGYDGIPEYDLEGAEFVLSFGANFLEAGPSPVRYNRGFGEMRQGRPTRRGMMVQVEPRLSLTAASADRWFPINPGTEGALALGIAHLIVNDPNVELDAGALAQSAREAWRAPLAEFTPENVANLTGMNVEDIRELARQFAAGRPSLAIGGGTVEGNTNAVSTLVAINALNVLVGNVGRAGGVRFAPPLPLQDELTATPARFQDMQGYLDQMRNGQVQAVLVHDANLAYALPGPDALRDALAQVPLVVSFSSVIDDTTAYADFVLPDNNFLESFNTYVSTGAVDMPVLGVAQPVVSPLYETRNTADVLIQIARRLGGAVAQQLPWESFQQVLEEAVGELQALNQGSVTAADPEEMWQRMLQLGGWWNEAAQRPTVSPNAQAIAGALRFEAPVFEGDEGQFPFHLIVYEPVAMRENVGANLPNLQELPDPMTTVVWGSWVEMNPRTMEELGLQQGDLLGIWSNNGRIEVPVYPYPGIGPNVLAMPLGQGHRKLGRYASNRGANPMRVVAPVLTQEGGGLAFNATRVRVDRAPGTGKLVTVEGNSHKLPANAFLDLGRGFFGEQ